MVISVISMNPPNWEEAKLHHGSYSVVGLLLLPQKAARYLYNPSQFDLAYQFVFTYIEKDPDQRYNKVLLLGYYH